MSTRFFISGAGFALVSILFLVMGIIDIVSGKVASGIGSIFLFGMVLYLGISFLLDGFKVRGMSQDQSLIAAALFDSIKRNGPGGPVRMVSISDDDSDVDHDEFVRQMTAHGKNASSDDENQEGSTPTSGSLDELRKARKGPNASD